MHGHLGTKSGDFLGEALFCLGSQTINPEGERGTGGGEESFPLVGFEFVGERDRGELGCVENLVRVRVTDAADESRISEGTLEGSVFKSERGTKAVDGL